MCHERSTFTVYSAMASCRASQGITATSAFVILALYLLERGDCGHSCIYSGL